jgi:hypothetical protein
MKKSFTLLFFAVLFSTITFGQTTQTYNIDVSSLDFGTTKSNIIGGGGFGNFNLIGKTADGNSFLRTSRQNSLFWASFFACNPCRKTNVFGGFTAGSWITAGNPQDVHETVHLNDLQVEVPAWSMRLSPPKRSLLAKRLPIVMHGSIKVRDDRNLPNIIEYIDNDVYLTGTMSVEFFQYSADSGITGAIDWRKIDVLVSKP